jgi:hypothetical protein
VWDVDAHVSEILTISIFKVKWLRTGLCRYFSRSQSDLYPSAQITTLFSDCHRLQTNSTEQSPPWGAESHETGQEIPRFSCNRIYYSPPLDLILNQIKQVRILTQYYLKDKYQSILPSTLISLNWSRPFNFSDQNYVCIPHFSHVYVPLISPVLTYTLTQGSPTTCPRASEGFVGARENFKIFVILCWLVTDESKARGDFRYMNSISVQCRGVLMFGLCGKCLDVRSRNLIVSIRIFGKLIPCTL